MKASKDTDIARLVVLAETNLQDQQGNANQKEGHQVGDKEGSSTVVGREGRKSPNVTESDGRSNGGKVELQYI